MRLRWAAPTALMMISFLLAGCSSSSAPNATPQITGLFPSEITAGSQAFTLFVGGTQFISTSTVQWNGSNRPTTFNSASGQLAASITSTDVQNAGIASVTVTSPPPGGGTSLAVSFTINPVHTGGPTITSLSPSSAVLNGAAFTLMVTGTNFAPSDYVTWNGGLRTTTFTSSTQVSAAIPVSDLTQQMTAGVAVHTSQLGVASPSVSFQVGSSTSSSAMPQIVSVNALGGPADGASSSPAVSGDGRFVAFYSEARNVVASGASGNIFVRDTCSGAANCTPRTIAADLAPDGSPPNGVASAVAISTDGRYIAFSSRATNLVSDVLAGQAQLPRAFIRDLCWVNSAPVSCTPHTELISIGAQNESVTGDEPTMSADGRFVAFIANSKWVVVQDTCHGVAACNPRGTIANVDGEAWIPAAGGDPPSVSQTGRYVAFSGWPAWLGQNSPGQKPQIFLRDTCLAALSKQGCTPSTIRVSVASDGAFGDAASRSPSVSADGRFVVFESAASNLTFDSTTREDIYLRDTCFGPTAPLGCSPSTTRISTDAELVGQSLGNYSPTISPSGRYISYVEQIARESGSNSSGVGNVIVYDTCFGTLGPCSAGPLRVLAPDGSVLSFVFGEANHEPVPLTPDGRFVVFFTRDAVSAAPVSGLGDVYLTTTQVASRH